MNLSNSEPIPPEPDREPVPEPVGDSQPTVPEKIPGLTPEPEPDSDPQPEDQAAPESAPPDEVPPAEEPVSEPEPFSAMEAERAPAAELFPDFLNEQEPDSDLQPEEPVAVDPTQPVGVSPAGEPLTESGAVSEPEAAPEPDLIPLPVVPLPSSSIPDLESTPPPPPSLRRRRYRRRLVPWDLEQRAEFFRELIHQSTPSFDFFLFSVIAGVAAGAALLLDSPALFILAALLSPFMAPVLGLGLASATGRLGFFVRSLFVLAIGSALVFGLGVAAGWVGQNIPGLAFTQVVFHSTFSWPDLVVVILGAALTAYLAVRSPKQRPLVSSVALAYELYLPLAASGFGWVWSMPGVYPDGLILFAINLALAAVTGAFMLVLLGVHPLPGSAWVVSVLLLLVLVGAVLFGIGTTVLPEAFSNPLAIFICLAMSSNPSAATRGPAMCASLRIP